MCQLAALPYLDVQLDIDILVHWHIGILAYYFLQMYQICLLIGLFSTVKSVGLRYFCHMKLITSQIIQVL